RVQRGRELDRRAQRMAPGRRAGVDVRGGVGAPRGAAGLRPPARLDPARHLPRDLRPGPRPDLLEPDREPDALRRRALRGARGPRLRARAGLGLRRPVPVRAGVMSPGVAVVGAAESDAIGVVPDRSALQLHAEAAANALAHAGLALTDVDALFTCGLDFMP